MFGVSGARISSSLRWLFSFAVIVFAATYWDVGGSDIWRFVGFASASICGYWIIKDLFVRPLENQILDLSLKIEALQRRIDRKSQ